MQLFEYIDMPNRPYDIIFTDYIGSALHWHYYSEIIYITKGKVAVTCNNRTALLEEGDLCYIYPLQLHAVAKADEAPAEHAVLRFDIHTIHIPRIFLSQMYDCFIRRTQENDFCIVLKKEQMDLAKIDAQIRQIVNEYQEKKEFYSLQIQADIYTILIEIARKMEKDSAPVTGGHLNQNDAFYHILEYIDTHSGEPLEIQKLADMCHMSYSHFAKLFRECYGRSCGEYITYIRLNKAQDYLLHTDYDLNEIALETGFFDASHFIRTYKKWRGITPKQERLKMRNN